MRVRLEPGTEAENSSLGTPGAAGPPAVVGVLGHDLWPDRTWAASD
jgi:hypothetical protein